MGEDNDDMALEDDGLDDLSDEDLAERAIDDLCGLSLDEFLAKADLAEPRDALGSFGMVKVGVAAREVLGSDLLEGPSDVAELALILIECIVAAAKEHDAHGHKLAAGLRAFARDR